MKRRIIFVAAALCVLAAAVCGGCSCNPFAQKETPAPQPHLIEESQAESAPVRAIEEREERAVTGETFVERQEALFAAVTQGYKPTFTDKSADVEAVYESALAVLNRYIRNDFTEYERVHAIHDWLCYYVEYDSELYERYLSGASDITSDMDSFQLSGVFLHKSAVCDGLSKAFTLLCAVEGIESVRLLGEYATANGADAHAWNKVKVDGLWYNVDATLDRGQVDINGVKKAMMHHGYFMVSDKAISDVNFGRHTADTSIEVNPVNEATPTQSYPVYKDFTVQIGNQTYDALVTDQAKLDELIIAVRKAKREIGKLDIQIAFDGVNPNRVGALDTYLLKSFENLKNSDFAYNPNIGTRPYFQCPDGIILLLIYV